MVLGSGRALLDDPSLLPTYRGAARPPLLLANLGAVGSRRARAAPGSSSCSTRTALSVHLNPVQEAVQPEGEARFGDALDRIAACVAALAPLPVVVKEVGFGMDARDVRRAAPARAWRRSTSPGAGGTNWALIEGRRDPAAGEVAAAFADWGVPTARAVATAVAAAPGLPVIASGGLRDGVDVAKCLALGARRVRARAAAARRGAGRPGRRGAGALVGQLRIAVWACGAASAAALDAGHLA